MDELVKWLKALFGASSEACAMPKVGDEVMADLDRLLTSPVRFKFAGRTHLISPMTTENFFRVTDAMNAISKLSDSKKADKKEAFVDAYTNVFSVACPSIKRKDVESMTLAQCGALLSLIVECVQGKAQKKNPQTEQEQA